VARPLALGASAEYGGGVREPVANTLAGSLLIAHPSMMDPNFHRAVIMLPEHNTKDGSFGVILNRPTGKFVGDLLQNQTLGQLARVPVLNGGPVQSDQLLLAAFRWHPQTSMLECRHHISLEEAEQLATAQHHTVRAFVGYAGWTGGQLEGELAQRAWLVHRADQQDVLELDRAPMVWRDLTSTFGPWFRLVAEAPDDPSMN
jgi:putative transcriptional regulator